MDQQTLNQIEAKKSELTITIQDLQKRRKFAMAQSEELLAQIIACQGATVEANGVRDDAYCSGVLTVPCDANGDVYFQCLASGSGTLDVTLQIWGYWL